MPWIHWMWLSKTTQNIDSFSHLEHPAIRFPPCEYLMWLTKVEKHFLFFSHLRLPKLWLSKTTQNIDSFSHLEHPAIRFPPCEYLMWLTKVEKHFLFFSHLRLPKLGVPPFNVVVVNNVPCFNFKVHHVYVACGFKALKKIYIFFTLETF